MFISLNVYEMKPHVSPENELQKIYIPVFKYHTHTPYSTHMQAYTCTHMYTCTQTCTLANSHTCTHSWLALL